MKYLIFLLLSFPVFSQEETHRELYTYQTTGKTVRGEALYQVSIHKHLFLPALEAALSETGAVKIVSLKIQRTPYIGRKTSKNQQAHSMAFRVNVGATAYMFFNMNLLVDGTFYRDVSCSLKIDQNDTRKHHRTHHQLAVSLCNHSELDFDLEILSLDYGNFEETRPFTIQAAKYLCQNKVRVAGEACRKWREVPNIHVKF